MTKFIQLTGADDKSFLLSPEKIIAMEPIQDSSTVPEDAKTLISTPIGTVYVKEFIGSIEALIDTAIRDTHRLTNRL